MLEGVFPGFIDRIMELYNVEGVGRDSAATPVDPWIGGSSDGLQEVSGKSLLSNNGS